MSIIIFISIYAKPKLFVSCSKCQSVLNNYLCKFIAKHKFILNLWASLWYYVVHNPYVLRTTFPWHLCLTNFYLNIFFSGFFCYLRECIVSFLEPFPLHISQRIADTLWRSIKCNSVTVSGYMYIRVCRKPKFLKLISR